MKKYAFVNQKGGVGKTTLAHNSAAGLALRGRKVLAIDLDAQMNLTTASRATGENGTIRDVLNGELSIAEAAEHTPEGYDVVAASAGLVTADRDYFQGMKGFLLLAHSLENLTGYDVVVMDAPPNLGILTLQALIAADAAVIATTPEPKAVEAINRTAETIVEARELNPSLCVAAVVCTSYDRRAALYRQLAGEAEEIAAAMGAPFLTLRRTVLASEAMTARESLFKYAPRAAIIDDLNAVIDTLDK